MDCGIVEENSFECRRRGRKKKGLGRYFQSAETVFLCERKGGFEKEKGLGSMMEKRRERGEKNRIHVLFCIGGRELVPEDGMKVNWYGIDFCK